MAIAFSNVSIDNSDTTSTTITRTLTNTSGTSGFFGLRTNTTPTTIVSATYGGVSLGTFVTAVNSVAPNQVHHGFGGTGLPTGSNTLSITFSGSTYVISCTGNFYSGAGAITSSDTSGSTTGNVSSRTITLNPTAVTDWVVAFGAENAGFAQVWTGRTIRNNVNVGSADSGGQVGAIAPYTMTMSGGTFGLNVSGFSFGEFVAVSNTTNNFFKLYG